MSQGDQKSAIDQQEKDKMLDDLESLSQMLDDEDAIDDDDAAVPEDIPILKSFVDDVPVLNDSLLEDQVANKEDQVEDQPSDSLDRNAGSFSTTPVSSDKLDMSFLDKDPLEISAGVRNRQIPAVQAKSVPPESAPQKPLPDKADSPKAEATPKHAPSPAAVQAEPIQADSTQANSAHEGAAMPEAVKPLERFQPQPGGENPFLPRSTLNKIRENHARESRFSDDASTELRKLLQENPLNKLSFESSNNNSKEFRDLRQKASQMVNEVIRASMPRLEAELRMKLEQEVDRLFKDAKKN